jgi:nitroreductase
MADEGKTLWSDVAVPQTGVSVYEALYQRRSVWRYQDRPVPHETLERLLQTVAWAPNHRMTEPWRFVVMEQRSELRERLSTLVYDEMLKEMDDTERAEAYRTKVLEPPVIAYVYNVQGRDEFGTRENYASVAMGIQNMALAGVAEGLAVTLETGRVTRVPGLGGLLGAADDWEMVGMLSIGYPDEESVAARTPMADFVRWG